MIVLSQLSENEQIILTLENENEQLKRENLELKNTHEGIVSIILTEVVQIGGDIRRSILNLDKENLDYSPKHLSVISVIVTKVIQHSVDIGTSVFKLFVNQLQAVGEQRKPELNEDSFDLEFS